MPDKKFSRIKNHPFQNLLERLKKTGLPGRYARLQTTADPQTKKYIKTHDQEIEQNKMLDCLNNTAQGFENSISYPKNLHQVTNDIVAGRIDITKTILERIAKSYFLVAGGKIPENCPKIVKGEYQKAFKELKYDAIARENDQSPFNLEKFIEQGLDYHQEFIKAPFSKEKTNQTCETNGTSSSTQLQVRVKRVPTDSPLAMTMLMITANHGRHSQSGLAAYPPGKASQNSHCLYKAENWDSNEKKMQGNTFTNLIENASSFYLASPLELRFLTWALDHARNRPNNATEAQKIINYAKNFTAWLPEGVDTSTSKRKYQYPHQVINPSNPPRNAREPIHQLSVHIDALLAGIKQNEIRSEYLDIFEKLVNRTFWVENPPGSLQYKKKASEVSAALDVLFDNLGLKDISNIEKCDELSQRDQEKKMIHDVLEKINTLTEEEVEKQLQSSFPCTNTNDLSIESIAARKTKHQKSLSI